MAITEDDAEAATDVLIGAGLPVWTVEPVGRRVIQVWAAPAA